MWCSLVEFLYCGSMHILRIVVSAKKLEDIYPKEKRVDGQV